jgi:hypothetical protein
MDNFGAGEDAFLSVSGAYLKGLSSEMELGLRIGSALAILVKTKCHRFFCQINEVYLGQTFLPTRQLLFKTFSPSPSYNIVRSFYLLPNRTVSTSVLDPDPSFLDLPDTDP